MALTLRMIVLRRGAALPIPHGAVPTLHLILAAEAEEIRAAAEAAATGSYNNDFNKASILPM